MADIFTTIYKFLFDLLTGWGLNEAWATGIIQFLGAFVVTNFALLILIFNIWFERSNRPYAGSHRTQPRRTVGYSADGGRFSSC
jgi:hypothetical protein